jgi:cell division protein ZapA
MTVSMDKSIRVRVLGRELALRVREEDEESMRAIAAYVDERMRAFNNAYPDQPEFTTAVVVALAIAEELFAERQEARLDPEHLVDALDALSDELDAALESAPERGETWRSA